MLGDRRRAILLEEVARAIEQVGAVRRDAQVGDEARYFIAAEPKRLLHLKGADDKGVESSRTYRFDPVGDTTRVTLDIDYEVSEALAGVVHALVYHQALERAVRQMADKFEALAEMKVPLPV